jgi:steroid delta-isomerase-like uncharacterized protein
MSLEGNKEIIRRLFEGPYNSHDLQGVADAFADDFVYHNPLLPNKLGGKQTIVGNTAAGYAGFPDMHWEVQDVFAEGDRVALRFSFGGTNTQAFMGMPATVRSAWAGGNLIFRLSGGRIVELWEECDYLGFLGQLGLQGLPPM